MGATYEIWICDPQGQRLASITRFAALTYARRIHQRGGFTLALPKDFPRRMLIPDGRVEIWRSVEPLPGKPATAPRLETETVWFIDTLTRERDEHGEESLTIAGPSAVDIVNRRIVAFPAGHAGATDDGPADTSLYWLVRESLGVGATQAAIPGTKTNRNVSEWLSLPQPTGVAATIDKQFAWRNVLDVCREICDATLVKPPAVYFDVVRETETKLAFRIYLNQRGTDRGIGSNAPVVFSEQFGNLIKPRIRYDYSAEVNAAYAGGQGEGADRYIASVEDVPRIKRSPFGRKETFTDARNGQYTTEVDDDARSSLGAGRPRKTITGTLIDTPAARYGVDWGFGDRVVTAAFGEEAEVVINGIHVTVTEDGSETVEPILDNEDPS